MAMSFFNHLKLKEWPFSVVPRQQHCDFLAGRPQFRSDISTLIRALSRKDTSSIHVLWAWLGAGKTHSLYYLMTQATLNNTGTHVELHAVYSEFAKQAKGFFDLYQSVISGIDRRFIANAFLEATTSPQWAEKFAELSDSNPDLSVALRTIAIGSEADQSIAVRWLRGDAIPVAEFRRLGISQKISSADQAVNILSAVVQLADMASRSRGRQGFRLVWIIDEFQRVARYSKNLSREINAGLHSLFNACPIGLTIILSFSGTSNESVLPDWLSPELRDRIGATKVMVLPPFQRTEALAFLTDIFSHFRSAEEKPSTFFPFSREACEYVIDHLSKKIELRPRMIMHAMNAVLEAADSRMEDGSLKEIDKSFAQEVLKEYVVLADSEAEEN